MTIATLHNLHTGQCERLIIKVNKAAVDKETKTDDEFV